MTTSSVAMTALSFLTAKVQDFFQPPKYFVFFFWQNSKVFAFPAQQHIFHTDKTCRTT